MKRSELEAEIAVQKALINKKALELHNNSQERVELEHQLRKIQEKLPALLEAEKETVLETGAELRHLGSLLSKLETHDYQPG